MIPQIKGTREINWSVLVKIVGLLITVILAWSNITHRIENIEVTQIETKNEIKEMNNLLREHIDNATAILHDHDKRIALLEK